MRIEYATVAEVAGIVGAWNGVPSTLEHISDSGSSVFVFCDASDTKRILRVTDATFRTRAEVEAELAFLSHLKGKGVPVAGAVPNKAGLLTTEYRSPITEHRPQVATFTCSVIEYAEGLDVRDGSPHWNED